MIHFWGQGLVESKALREWFSRNLGPTYWQWGILDHPIHFSTFKTIWLGVLDMPFLFSAVLLPFLFISKAVYSISICCQKIIQNNNNIPNTIIYLYVCV